MGNFRSTGSVGRINVAIVGMGPRGTYALERLIAVLERYPPRTPVEVHLVEPHELGAGLVYRTTQPSYLLMNTVASQITAYPDSSVTDAGPVNLGPSLYEWLTKEGASIGPDDYPSRADHGRYLNAVVQQILANPPKNVSIHVHPCSAVDIVPTVNGNQMHFADATFVDVDHVLLAAGNVGNQDPPKPIVKEPGGTVVITNPYPVEDHMARFAPGASVGIIGLGLTAIDVILAATVGRGGRFVQEGGELRYRASGHDLRLFAWSRTGVPLYGRATNQKGSFWQRKARIVTTERIERIKGERGMLDFFRDIQPLVVQEMKLAYYEALEGSSFADALEHAYIVGDDETPLVSSVPSELRFDFNRIANPPELAKEQYTGADEYRERIAAFLRRDLEEAKRGNKNGPMKAACDVLRDVRDNIRYAVEFGSLTPQSQSHFARHFNQVNNRLAVGPPAFRLSEWLALMEAGVLDLSLGPDPAIALDGSSNRVSVESTRFKERKEVLLDAIVDARIPFQESPLIKRLVLKKVVRLAENAGPYYRFPIRTIDVTQDGYCVSGDGAIQRWLAASGQLSEGTLWYTQVAARPGVNSRSLQDAGKWALRIREKIGAME